MKEEWIGQKETKIKLDLVCYLMSWHSISYSLSEFCKTMAYPEIK